MKKRFIEEQIIGILRQAEIDGVVIRDPCRKHNITEQTFSGGGTSTTGMNLDHSDGGGCSQHGLGSTY